MTLHEDVFATVAAFQQTKATTDQEVVDELMARGYDHLRAELLAVFVPLGLARALIARLPEGRTLGLSKTAIVLDGKRQRTVLLASVPEFEMARHIGEENFATGAIPRDLFGSVVAFSIELTLINKALYAEKEIKGAKFSPPVLIRLADAPGFEIWYETVSARSN